MPGLFGFFALTPGSRLERGAASGLLREMAHRMGHLGDEIVETWTDLAQGISVARIRIPTSMTADFPDGRGPVEARRRVFVGGMIHEDAAVRLRDLQEQGSPALGQLEGSFSVALWEPRRSRLTLAVDRRASLARGTSCPRRRSSPRCGASRRGSG
jgi:asparagine synthetase B (glutamine-hydrolysing)